MTYSPPPQRNATLRNGAYGFPQGSKKRRIKPHVLICIHISGNKRTASYEDPLKGTAAEVSYVARDRNFDSPTIAARDYGNSAHSYIAREGTIFQLYPISIAGWNNGRLLRPNTKLRSVRRILDLMAKGYNANECYVREVECTGFPGSYPITKEQRESVAYLIARDSIKTGLAINRETVHGHFDLDSVNRRSCPTGADPDKWLGRIIDRAKAIRAQLVKDGQNPGPDPDPDPGPGPDPDYKTLYETTLGLLQAAEEDLDAVGEKVAKATDLLTEATAIIEEGS